MKKACCLLLCLILALAAPLSALAEPQSWLWPWTSRINAVKSAEAVMTVQVDPDAVQAVVDWYYDMMMDTYDEMAKTLAANYAEQGKAPEEAALYSYIKSEKQSLNTARATAKAYIPAAASLADASEILIRAGENLSAYEFRVDGNSWLTLNLIARPEEGDVLLTSNLFPSCAISLSQNSTGVSSLLFGTVSETYGKLLTLLRALLSTLPDYEGFDLLGQLYEADVQALALLEAEGLAHREGDALVYEYTVSLPGAYNSIPDETEDALYERRAMDVDERVYRLYDLTAPLREYAAASSASSFWEEEGASDTLPELGENATDEEYADAYGDYFRLTFKNRTQTTTQTRRVVLENGEITNETTVTLSTHYEPLNDETGTIEKLREHYPYFQDSEDYESITGYTARHTPTLYEYRRMPTDYSEEVFRLDTSAENEIVLSYVALNHRASDGNWVEEETATLLLTRTDEGQQWTLSMDVLADAEPLRVTLSLDNDMTRMDLGLSLLGMELGGIRAKYAYSDAPAALPDVSGLTVIPYDGAEAMKALYAELRTVAVPRLTRLVTTGLPKGAQGLIAPLLGVVVSLGRMGQ